MAKTAEEYLQEGLSLAASSRAEEALEIFSEGLSFYPDNFPLRQQRSRKAMALRPWQAVSDFKIAADLPGSDWEAHYYMGVAFALAGAWEEATAPFRKAFDECEKNGISTVPARDWLWTVLTLTGQDASDALAGFDESVGWTEDDYPYFRRLLLYTGKVGEEEFFDRKELGSRPATALVEEMTQRWGLATWYLAQGRKEEYFAQLKAVYESPEWHNCFAWLLARNTLTQEGMI